MKVSKGSGFNAVTHTAKSGIRDLLRLSDSEGLKVGPEERELRILSGRLSVSGLTCLYERQSTIRQFLCFSTIITRTGILNTLSLDRRRQQAINTDIPPARNTRAGISSRESFVFGSLS